jgi:ATP-dependent Clp protease ATP-binding subunit ClpA
MFQRFTKDARTVVKEAVVVARELGSPSVEAEHLLLAVARTSDVLGALDEATLRAALERETERSLAAVGVSADTPAFSPYAGDPKLATSAKVALQNALKESLQRKDREIAAAHLAAAILRPAHGTVPRALAIAGLERPDPYANP